MKTWVQNSLLVFASFALTLFITEYNETHFLDLQEIFYNDFKVNNKKLEFKTDGHWSPYGHSIASEALTKKTREILNITR